MGVIKRGILGGVSGSVGNVVGTSWKGIAIIKAKPLSVSNPKTAGQVAQRGKMANIVAFSKEILTEVIKPLWDRFAQQKSGFNAFVQANIDLFTTEYGSTPSELVISQGKMASTPIDSLTPAGDGLSFDVAWTDDSGDGLKLATDIPYAVVVNKNDGTIAVANGVAGSVSRATESLTVPNPDGLSDASQLDVYLAFRRSDGTVVSNTAYLQYT